MSRKASSRSKASSAKSSSKYEADEQCVGCKSTNTVVELPRDAQVHQLFACASRSTYSACVSCAYHTGLVSQVRIALQDDSRRPASNCLVCSSSGQLLEVRNVNGAQEAFAHPVFSKIKISTTPSAARKLCTACAYTLQWIHNRSMDGDKVETLQKPGKIMSRTISESASSSGRPTRAGTGRRGRSTSMESVDEPPERATRGKPAARPTRGAAIKRERSLSVESLVSDRPKRGVKGSTTSRPARGVKRDRSTSVESEAPSYSSRGSRVKRAATTAAQSSRPKRAVKRERSSSPESVVSMRPRRAAANKTRQEKSPSPPPARKAKTTPAKKPGPLSSRRAGPARRVSKKDSEEEEEEDDSYNPSKRIERASGSRAQRASRRLADDELTERVCSQCSQVFYNGVEAGLHELSHFNKTLSIKVERSKEAEEALRNWTASPVASSLSSGSSIRMGSSSEDGDSEGHSEGRRKPRKSLKPKKNAGKDRLQDENFVFVAPPPLICLSDKTGGTISETVNFDFENPIVLQDKDEHADDERSDSEPENSKDAKDDSPKTSSIEARPNGVKINQVLSFDFDDKPRNSEPTENGIENDKDEGDIDELSVKMSVSKPAVNINSAFSFDYNPSMPQSETLTEEDKKEGDEPTDAFDDDEEEEAGHAEEASLAVDKALESLDPQNALREDSLNPTLASQSSVLDTSGEIGSQGDTSAQEEGTGVSALDTMIAETSDTY